MLLTIDCVDLISYSIICISQFSSSWFHHMYNIRCSICGKGPFTSILRHYRFSPECDEATALFHQKQLPVTAAQQGKHSYPFDLNSHSTEDDDDSVLLHIPKSSIKKRQGRSVFLDSSNDEETSNKENTSPPIAHRKPHDQKNPGFLLPEASSSSESESSVAYSHCIVSKLPPALRRTNHGSIDDSEPSDDELVIRFSKKERTHKNNSVQNNDAIYPGLRTPAKSPRFNAVARNFATTNNPIDIHTPSMHQSTQDSTDEVLECWSTEEERKHSSSNKMTVGPASPEVIDVARNYGSKSSSSTMQNPYGVGPCSESRQSTATRNPYTSRPTRVPTERPSKATAALLATEPTRRRRDPSMAGAVQATSGLWYRHGAPQLDIHAIPLPSNWRPRNDLFGGSGVGTGNYQLEQASLVQPPVKKAARKTRKTSTTTKKTSTFAKRKYVKKKGGGKRNFKKKGTGASRSGGEKSRAAPTTNDAWSSGYQHRTSAAPVSRTDATLNHVGGASITF